MILLNNSKEIMKRVDWALDTEVEVRICEEIFFKVDDSIVHYIRRSIRGPAENKILLKIEDPVSAKMFKAPGA
jgi:hypothetical protein